LEKPSDEVISRVITLFPEIADQTLTVCQRMRWVILKNFDLYKKTNEDIYLAMMICCEEAQISAKKMSNKLIEYKANVQPSVH
jgi:hypothetical protein